MFIKYKKEGRIALFTLNRPEVLNAQNLQLLGELNEAMKDFRDDNECWVGIITGAGDKAFCAGADIRDILPYMKMKRGCFWAFPDSPMRGLDLWKPLIAAINGLALGGGLEIVLACDIRIASESARLGVPEVLLGIIPGAGGTQRLPRMIPWCKAAELLLTGRSIDAKEAYRIGLVNEVVSQENLMSKAKEWALRICEAGPLAVRAAKEAMIRGINMSLYDGLRLEDSLESSLLGTEDYVEGTSSFLEKRKPNFKAK
jgi:E-phenylitaconyl-CoA hydratase